MNSTTKNRFTEIAIWEKLIAYLLWFFIPAVVAVALFYLRPREPQMRFEDSVYSLTAFLILTIPAYIGLFVAYYKYERE